jgi:hypothetical protein
MAVPAILVGIIGSVAGLLKALENPVVAYFVVLGFIIADAGVGLALGYQGVLGILFSFVFQMLNFPIVVYSYQVLICLAIFPFAVELFKSSL